MLVQKIIVPKALKLIDSGATSRLVQEVATKLGQPADKFVLSGTRHELETANTVNLALKKPGLLGLFGGVKAKGLDLSNPGEKLAKFVESAKVFVSK